ncbi:TIGR02391 family protein [Streptomyces olivaceus]|nr:TIGR02391 family protein [Streptomyces olivaceus]
MFLEWANQHIVDLEAAQFQEGVPYPGPHQELELEEVVVRQIENAYVPKLGDYVVDHYGPLNRWAMARDAAVQALGRARSADDIAMFLRPSSPSIAAAALHPWAWEPAAPLWAAEAYQDAVLAAARTLNRRFQQKVGRHDVGEYDLAMQAFDLKEPAVGKPRLRSPGDRASPSWRARQEGAKYMTAGAFLAIRNVAAHEEDTDWGQQEALEYLATLSVIAHWIEECTVETAP